MSIGILGYGSLVSDPGPEIEEATDRIVDVVTPFQVEYARHSAGRSQAPTLVPVPKGKGAQVKAKIFMLRPQISYEDACNILYRREGPKIYTGHVIYDDKIQREKKDGVVIERLEDFCGVETVLYTALGANVLDVLNSLPSEEQKAEFLARAALDSVTRETFEGQVDGIKYLDDAIDAEIRTPLTEAYRKAVLRGTHNAWDLSSARSRVACNRGLVDFWVGVDGCKAGWFAVWGGREGYWDFGVFRCIDELWQSLRNAALILADIPIGLPSNGARRCDKEARRVLGRPRCYSVFPAPCRDALDGNTYEEAKRINRRVLGKGLTMQCWGIVPKIRQVDRLLLRQRDARQVIRESHPEITFWALANRAPMKHRKSSKDGISERLSILEKEWPTAALLYTKALSSYLRKEVARDDILDAAAMFLTASLPREGLISIPEVPDKDDAGLSMEMVCACVRGKTTVQE